MAPVIDLMEALKKSLADKKAAAPAAVPSPPAAGPVAVPAGKKPPARAVEPAPVAQKRSGKKLAG
jgi:hypothetical protein